MEKDQLTEFCLDIHWSPTRAWPWLHHMTSAFVPEYYPKAFVDYANTGGADKIMYVGYYPMGLSLDRIFSELPDVPSGTKSGPCSCVRTHEERSNCT